MPGQVIDVDRSDEALAEVCRRLDYDAHGAVLVRRGTNAVYRLASVPVIVRVALAVASRREIERQVSIARWLAGEGVPAVRLVDVHQPIEAAGHFVTMWESVGDGRASELDQYGTTAELGHVLRQLHATPASSDLLLPPLNPVTRLHEQVPRLTHLPGADRVFLANRVQTLSAAFEGLVFDLPAGGIHGDANVGNLLRTRDGDAVLSDLDGFCTGPREWDLVLTAMFTDRYGWHTEAEYRAFVEAYGHDLRQWDGYEVLADVRELLMVVWNAGNAARSEEHARELKKRLRSLRTGQGRDTWTPL